MADYNQTLQWLQNLLGNTQSLYANQFGQGLSAEQEAFGQNLGERGRQFDASLALQKVIADWQNTLAQRQQAAAEQAQKFGQSEELRQTSFPYQSMQSFYQNLASPQTRQATDNFITNFMSRFQPQTTQPTFTPALPLNVGNALTGYGGIPQIYTRGNSGLP